ncbi:MFS transporter [Agathobaculum sp.]|uniref:MFS transporter n=1 Tax=Agathobaculum sp. TaxID=2048138 RepID=UPI002A7EF18C|nr:MFS transporter [Agathobaculum sp.]MDY3618325.1 MFS transporter [Agathobaculum sp.]
MLGKRRGFVVGTLFWVYVVHGLTLIMLGTVLPNLREAYALDYGIGGMLLSIQSVGFLITGLFSGMLAVKFGLKRAYLLLFALGILGLAMLLADGAPLWLLAAMLLIGVTKGSVCDYNNRVVSSYSGGDSQPLNLLHALYAVGACLAPLVVLLCLRADSVSGWRLALIIAIALNLSAFIIGMFMKMDPVAVDSCEQAQSSFGFFRERLFWQTTAIGFFYQAVEASIIGWLTSFYVGSGTMDENSAQLVTAVLWVSLLVGRLTCTSVAARFHPWQMILVMCIGMAAFLALLLVGNSLPLMLAATIGLGLCMSGMYGTSVANAGDMFTRYPICMGIFVTLIGIGAVAAPTAVGLLADLVGIRLGMAVLLAGAALLVVSAVINAQYFREKT